MDRQMREDILNAFRNDPEFSKALHLKSDVDVSNLAQHHTLGTRRSQAVGNSGDMLWRYVGATGEIAFKNSWGNVGFGAVPARYRKDGTGRVWVEGVINGGSAAVAFTLPAGYQSVKVLYLPGITGTSFALLTCGGGGDVIPGATGASAFSFSFSFLADE